jgi:hypothetical protein
MKSLVLFLLAVLALPLSLRAELLIYRETERATVTGNGREVAVPVVNYVVHDLNSGQFGALGLFRVGAAKYYVLSNDTPGYIISGRGQYTVFSQIANSNTHPDVVMGCYFAKGRDSVLKLSTNATSNFPRTLKAINKTVRFSSGVLATYESTSTLAFQAAETARANNAGDTTDVVLERLRQRFAAQGYVPNP